MLLDLVSVGGMAEVFHAKRTDGDLEEVLAIKRILPSICEDSDFVKMFVDEASIAGQLSHPNIAKIFELGRDNDSHFIAMEYIWGKDLLQIQRRFKKMGRTMPAIMACYIVSKICEGLHYAHTKRDDRGVPLEIVHRDCSPQNVLVSYEGHVKLIDFGIARAATRSSRTNAGVLKGKFGYMSPEQVRGMSLDHRSDIFALGTVLWECLTGKRLFFGESDFSTLEKVRDAVVPLPSEFEKSVPKEVETILLKALAREPSDRYSTCAEMNADLRAFIGASGRFYSSAQLSKWLKTSFAKDIKREHLRLTEYKFIDANSVARAAPVSEELDLQKTSEFDGQELEMAGAGKNSQGMGKETILGGEAFKSMSPSKSSSSANDIDESALEPLLGDTDEICSLDELEDKTVDMADAGLATREKTPFAAGPSFGFSAPGQTPPAQLSADASQSFSSSSKSSSSKKLGAIQESSPVEKSTTPPGLGASGPLGAVTKSKRKGVPNQQSSAPALGSSPSKIGKQKVGGPSEILQAGGSGGAVNSPSALRPKPSASWAANQDVLETLDADLDQSQFGTRDAISFTKDAINIPTPFPPSGILGTAPSAERPVPEQYMDEGDESPSMSFAVDRTPLPLDLDEAPEKSRRWPLFIGLAVALTGMIGVGLFLGFSSRDDGNTPAASAVQSSTLALVIHGEKTAKVLIDGEEKGTTQGNGHLALELSPGTYKYEVIPSGGQRPCTGSVALQNTGISWATCDFSKTGNTQAVAKTVAEEQVGGLATADTTLAGTDENSGVTTSADEADRPAGGDEQAALAAARGSESAEAVDANVDNVQDTAVAIEKDDNPVKKSSNDAGLGRKNKKKKAPSSLPSKRKAKSGKPGYLTVFTSPPGAKIFIDGKFTGRKSPVKPSNRLKVPPGKHVVKVVLGSRSKSQTITFKAGQTRAVSAGSK